MSLPPPLADALVSDPAFLGLKEYLIETTGLAYYAEKNEALADRIARRLRHLGLGDCAAYLALLRHGERGEAELDAIIEELTIGETFFFRHREVFDALRDRIIPELIERNQHSRRLRIWSAGCATGAEPYSLTILLRHDLAPQLDGWDITVIGTDINREFLARAREGRFEEWAFRSNPDDLKHSCFAPVGTSWVIADPFKKGVSFQYHNLVQHPYPSLVNNLFAFDLILCRNVTIYFSPDIVRTIVDRFHRCLVDHGWLLVGPAEPNTQLFRSFRQVSVPGAVLYQKSIESLFCKWEGEAPAEPFAPQIQARQEPRPPENTPSGTDSEAPTPPSWQPLPQPELEAPLPGPTAAIPWEPWLPLSFPESRSRPRERLVDSSEDMSLAEIRSLADTGEWEKADRACARLLAKAPLSPQAHFLSALLKEQAGLHQEAQEALRKVLYLDRHFVMAHYYLGLLLQKTGESRGAARSFRNALAALAGMDDEHAFAEAEGLTVADLKKLTRMNLDVLENA